MTRLKDALRAEIECHDAQLMTTPHLSAICHAERALLALLELKTGEESPADWRDRRIEELESALRPFADAATRSDDCPHAEVEQGDFARAHAALGGRTEASGPIHVLIRRIRGAISDYDRTGDHCSHQAQSDCVRCNAAEAVYSHGDPRLQPPRRRAS